MNKDIESAFKRIVSRIVVSPAGCWEWQGAIMASMYGQIKVAGKNVATHRVTYMAAKGEIPRGKIIRHTCDNRACCNPSHLIVGDHEDNVQDAIDRGRYAAKRRRLSSDECEKAIKMYAAGSTKRQVAEALKCNWYAVSMALDSSGKFEKRRCGRPKGTKNVKPRVSDEAKRQIAELYATGEFTQKQLAERFGCDQTYVSIIIKRAKGTT